VWASYDQSHGSYKKGVGSQTMYNKDEILDWLRGIYEEYDDPMIDQLPDNSARVFFRNDI
jgi:hypothetical protein